jgi:hypothetical protein
MAQATKPSAATLSLCVVSVSGASGPALLSGELMGPVLAAMAVAADKKAQKKVPIRSIDMGQW